MMDHVPSILETIDDPQTFGWHFRKRPETWTPWRALLAALFGIPPPNQLELYRACTGRTEPPKGPFTEG
jgi:hypothetical protein